MRGEPGTRIADRYLVTGEVGAGGMGVVLRARDERLGRAVAVKLLSAGALGDEAACKRLVREARAAASLDHRGIVHIYDVGETPDGGAFLVMELVRGKTLGEHLAEGTLSRVERIAAIVEIGEALAYAHAQGFIHRDIKPDNIMIREDGRAVVLDFGLAKAVATELANTVDAVSVTARGSFVGTPAYVSPEQARGHDVDGRTDQFALAVATFEVLTGRTPWHGETPLEIISDILRGEPMRLDELAPELPRDIGAAIARALAKKPDDRFPGITEFVAELAAVELSPEARPPPANPSLANAATISASIVAPSKEAHGSPRRSSTSRFMLLGSAAAILLAGATAVYFATRPPSRPASTPSNAVASPLATPGSILACPPLSATETGLPRAGWLGAAVSTLVCQRAQIVLGGASERTLVPAELLGLPREPAEGYPIDPYEEKGAREKAIAAARERATAFIDGNVDHSRDAFRISLDVRSKTGDPLGHSDGTDVVLVDAIRAAMEPLIASGAIPRATDSPFLKKWFPGCSIDGALALHDLHIFVLNEDTTGIRQQCDRADHEELGALGPFAKALCAEKLFRPQPSPPAFDASSTPALMIDASIRRMLPTNTDAERSAQRERGRALADARSKEPSADGRALLAAAEGELLYQGLGDSDAAAQTARASIQASPKLVDVRGTAWHRLSFTSGDRNLPVLAAHVAWLPWEPYAESTFGRSLDKDPVHSIEYTHRAAILGRRGYWMLQYGDWLLQLGRIEEARGIAVQTDSDFLRVLILHAETRPGAALELAASALKKIPANMENGSTAPRIASTGVDIATTLGKPIDFVDDFLDRFFYHEPPVISRGVVPFFSIMSICAHLDGPRSKRCTERLAALFEQSYFGGAIKGAREAIDGLSRHVEGDDAGAAREFRPLLMQGVFVLDSTRALLVPAFDRSGDVDLASRLDNESIAKNDRNPRTDLAYAREALRAQKRGDGETARKLAQAFVDRWEAADERPPMLAEMKKLLARGPK